MRRALIGGLLIGLCVLAWYLDGLLYDAAWVTNFTPDLKPDDIIRGWGILLAAWPLALVGVLVGGVVALVMFMLAYAYGQDEDHTREIERLQQVAIEAEQRAVHFRPTVAVHTPGQALLAHHAQVQFTHQHGGAIALGSRQQRALVVGDER